MLSDPSRNHLPQPSRPQANAMSSATSPIARSLRRRACASLALVCCACSNGADPKAIGTGAAGNKPAGSMQQAGDVPLWTSRLSFLERYRNLAETPSGIPTEAWLALEQDAILTVLTDEGNATELDPTAPVEPLAVATGDAMPIWFTVDERVFVALATRDRWPTYFRLLEDVRDNRRFRGPPPDEARRLCELADQIAVKRR
jgi:hypothetical protein